MSKGQILNFVERRERKVSRSRIKPTTSSEARGSGNLGQDWLTKIPFEVSFRFEVVGLPRSLEPLASLEVL